MAALVTLVMGLRAGEVVSRVVRDLDDEGKLLWIPDSKTEAGKRTLQVPDLLRTYLLALAEGKNSDDLLFGYPIGTGQGNGWRSSAGRRGYRGSRRTACVAS